MIVQDFAIHQEVLYKADHAMIVGKTIGIAQRLDGTRLVMLENSTGVFIGDIQRVHIIEQLKCMTTLRSPDLVPR